MRGGSTGSERPPDVSVIVSSWDRQRFLGRAIESVLQQTFPRGRTELILNTNFDPVGAIGPDAAKRFRIVANTAERQGPFFARALRLSTGRIVCLLDDDDLWAPERLAVIVSAFDRDPRLAFFHNAQLRIDGSGHRIAEPVGLGSLLTSRLSDPVGISGSDVPSGLNRAGRFDPYFNASSIAISGPAVREHLDYLERMERNEDSFLFYASLLSGGNIWLDARPLTMYRLHSENLSKSLRKPAREGLTGSYAWTSASIRSHRVLREMVADSRRPDLLPFIERDLALFQILNAVQAPDHERRRMGTAALSLARRLRTFDPRLNAGLLGLSMLFLASPRSGRRLYLRLRR